MPGFPGAGYTELVQRVGALGGFAPAYDAFAASIVHAYEPARRVLTSYTGNLVRLRRASDNAEANFGYLANGDLNVAAIAAWAGGASYVVTIYDQGIGDDITMAVAANQMLYVANARNGHAGMLFDGTDYLQGAFTTGGALSQPYNLLFVAKLGAGLADDGVIYFLTDGDDAANEVKFFKHKDPIPDAWRFASGNSIEFANADSNWHVWAALFSGAASLIRSNAVQVGAGNTGAENADGFTLGAENNGANPWKGYATSAIICDPSLSVAQLAAMEIAMNAYWGVY